MKGNLKYCGYVVGKDISPEQMEKLFHFLHGSYSKRELITMRDQEIHQIAKEFEKEWIY